MINNRVVANPIEPRTCIASYEAARRLQHESKVFSDATEEPEHNALQNDLRSVLDAELSQLPEKYRAAFVLCYLDGKTNEQAAQELGCPKGTILSRLAWARARLRARAFSFWRMRFLADKE